MKIAIKGHPTRGKDVIKLLESIDGINISYFNGDNSYAYYYIDKNNCIDKTCNTIKIQQYKFYTLEEFEKEFPFKIGDNVQIEIDNIIYLATITGIVDVSIYRVIYTNGSIGFVNKEHINIYNEMSTRNITLTLDKAKEWYQKGGELKEVALQAFTEKELNTLPKSWEEYRKMYPSRASQSIFMADYPKKYTALWKLEKLRDCYRQGWTPDWTSDIPIDSIFIANKEINVTKFYSKHFLSFQSEEVAKEFKKNFELLIKEAEEFI